MIANQSQTLRKKVANQSLVADFYGQFSPTGPQLVADRLPIYLQLKIGGFYRTVVALVAAIFRWQGNWRNVAVCVIGA